MKSKEEYQKEQQDRDLEFLRKGYTAQELDRAYDMKWNKFGLKYINEGDLIEIRKNGHR